MALFPENIEERLGVHQIRNWIGDRCQSEGGRQQVAALKWTDSREELERRFATLQEFQSILGEEGVPSMDFVDYQSLLARLSMEGAFLEGSDLRLLGGVLQTLVGWNQFFQKLAGYPMLASDWVRLELSDAPASAIDQALDLNGEVLDAASPELAHIRKRIIAVEKSARAALQKMLKASVANEYSLDDSQVTLREGRLVIPVKAEYKRKLPGLIHDESATGQTVFIEPSEALEFNNEVRDLKNSERREVIRILQALTNGLRGQLPALKKGVGLTAHLDYLRAVCRWAEAFEAHIPTIVSGRGFDFRAAVHPALWFNHQRQQKSVVPLSVSLDNEHRILVISGPNAGGKSVVLQTVGLLQYLAQCGLPITAAEGSAVGLFKDLFLDIGDTQSLEENLSTYSAHLKAMKFFVNAGQKKTLFLIDEFGKGTEPQFGGAMAEAILEELHALGAFGIVTTHYQNLKALADRLDGVVNGAMKYDMQHLEPQFLLELGQPGSSFAFEIAQKIGLHPRVIEVARQKVGTSRVDYDRGLNQLEREKQKFDKLNQQLKKEKAQTTALKLDYEELRQLVEEERRQLKKEAKQEARTLMDEANRVVEQTIREIRENQADKEKTLQARARLDAERDKLSDAGHPSNKSLRQKARFEVGDRVRLEGQSGAGTLLTLKGNEAQVQFGMLKSFVSVDRLEKIASGKNPQQKSGVRAGSGLQKHKMMALFSHELNLIGRRSEEAVPALEKYIDEAMLLGVGEVRIVHGKGHGILRDMVRNTLKGYPHIESVSDEHADRGGSGITVVKFE